jgi:hypothetical protein
MSERMKVSTYIERDNSEHSYCFISIAMNVSSSSSSPPPPPSSSVSYIYEEVIT